MRITSLASVEIDGEVYYGHVRLQKAKKDGPEEWVIAPIGLGITIPMPDPDDVQWVAVIDPRAGEDIDRLLRLLPEEEWEIRGEEDFARAHDEMSLALLTYARAGFATLEEPGTLGVVEASCVHQPEERRQWIHHEDGNWYPFGNGCTSAPDDWGSLLNPTLVRKGIDDE